MSRRTKLLIVFLGLALGVAPTGLAAKGGGKNGTAPSASCVAGSRPAFSSASPVSAFSFSAGGIVAATGLPTDQVINFLVTDSTGTAGRVLGFTPDGTWSVNVKAASGPTTYQFISRISGADGSRYTVFASCSA